MHALFALVLGRGMEESDRCESQFTPGGKSKLYFVGLNNSEPSRARSHVFKFVGPKNAFMASANTFR